MSRNKKSSHISKSIVALALIAAHSPQPALAHSDKDFLVTAVTSAGLSAVLIGGTTGGNMTATAGIALTTALTAAQLAEQKRALAAVAIEDAAIFYETGELTGILPAAVSRIRQMFPESANSTDAEIVDVIVEAAADSR